MSKFPKPSRVDRKNAREKKEREFRNAVWKRDGWVTNEHQHAFCRRCGSRVCRKREWFLYEHLAGEVDHIKPRSTHPELRYEPSNGRIVCFDCNRYLKTHPNERGLERCVR